MAAVSLSVIVVAHDSLSQLRRTVPPLLAQLRDADELIVVDNASSDGLAAQLASLAPDARLLSMGANVGFAAGVNAGARIARGELLVLLNPDALVAPGFAEAIREPWGEGWGAWMALVALADGQHVNTGGGVLHFTGFGWAGRLGEPVAAVPDRPDDVDFLSGACLAIPAATWRELDGFPERFFMYCEDVDLSLRLRLRGERIVLTPRARVSHDYEFSKGDLKWRLLERNRWATILRTYPAALLTVVAPALVLTECAVWAIAARGGWAPMKARATLDIVRDLPRLLAQRRRIQSQARLSAADFAAGMTAELSSPYFGAVGTQPLLRRAMAAYWWVATTVLRRWAGRTPAVPAPSRSAPTTTTR